jgi:peptide/nickel transport system permease protein
MQATSRRLPRWREEHAGQIEGWRRAIYRFRRTRRSVVGLLLVVLILLAATVGPHLVPYPDDITGAVHMQARRLPPSREHLFGTDEVGRDVFSRVIGGAAVSLRTGLIAVSLAIAIGVPLGAVAGFVGGPLDTLVMRATDIFLAFPTLILAIAIAAALGPSAGNAMLAVGLVWWPTYCRLIRGQVIAAREEAYVEAARAGGASNGWIIFQHVLPNCVSPVIVAASMDIGYAILVAAGLSFVGLGAPPPVPEWGRMVAEGRRYFPAQWWMSTFPGLAIFVTVFSFNLLGDGLRDLLDPFARR